MNNKTKRRLYLNVSVIKIWAQRKNHGHNAADRLIYFNLGGGGQQVLLKFQA